MSMPTINCIVINNNTGKSHYSRCGKDLKILDTFTYCGKPIHKNYKVVTIHIARIDCSCKTCKAKLTGNSHNFHDHLDHPW